MRELSEKGIAFSFSYTSYSRERFKTDGIVTVDRARLRPRTKEKYNEFHELLEEYIDLSNNEPRRFWRCTLMSFNNQPTHL
ncbi:MULTISPECIES: hypothetical protein [Olivibacter]|uniref:Uncharacterized protein n=1 Tax=Olivibacter jilunii TaxID=985016 RepID=A0ABW6B412_9SPHI